MPNAVESALIGAALALADSLDWDITDSGHAVVRCDYDEAERLSDAAQAYRLATGSKDVAGTYERQKATRGLASLVRRR